MSGGVSLEDISVELMRLRGDMREGFARIGGQLDLIAQSQSQDRKDLDDLEGRVTALEERRWPLAPMAAVSGAVSAVAAVVTYFAAK